MAVQSQRLSTRLVGAGTWDGGSEPWAGAGGCFSSKGSKLVKEGMWGEASGLGSARSARTLRLEEVQLCRWKALQAGRFSEGFIFFQHHSGLRVKQERK